MHRAAPLLGAQSDADPTQMFAENMYRCAAIGPTQRQLDGCKSSPSQECQENNLGGICTLHFELIKRLES
jgi:hypothetical protein